MSKSARVVRRVWWAVMASALGVACSASPPPESLHVPTATAAAEPPPVPQHGSVRAIATGASAAHEQPQNSSSALGTNLGSISDWSGEWPFVDAMKASRDWISSSQSTWDDGKRVDVDDHGWVRSLAPGQMVRTLMFWDLDGRYPLGRYTVLYTGRGALDYFGGAVRNPALSAPGRDVIDVGVGGIGVLITAIDARNPLRDIRVLMPGGVCTNQRSRYCDSGTPCGAGGTCEAFEKNYSTQIFHPQFLERLRSYRVVRFLNWIAANETKQREWRDRPHLSDARYSVRGAPLELMVELSNRLGADPWFTLPHPVSDAYVAEFATLARQKLDPSRKVYVEHSNEVWNGIFPQAEYARQRGAALGLSQNAFEGQLRYNAHRSVEIFKIFERRFGGKQRLVRVLATQAANPWTSTTTLGFPGAAQHADALAIAPYFGGSLGNAETLQRVRSLSPDALFDEIERKALPEAIGWMQAQAAVARQHGLKLIAYEGGQHLAGVGGAESDAQLNALFDTVNRHPRMKAVYLRYLQGWRAAGGELFVHYTNCGRYSQWGRWGALEFLSQPRSAAPKFDAIHAFIESTPAWW